MDTNVNNTENSIDESVVAKTEQIIENDISKSENPVPISEPETDNIYSDLSFSDIQNSAPAHPYSIPGNAQQNEDLQTRPTVNADIDKSFPVLQCFNLIKRYSNIPAVKGVNFTVTEGKILGLLGPNGSGKTTLLKMIAGLLTPTSGEISICGLPVGTETKKMVSYLPERTYFNENRSTNDVIKYFKDFYADFSESRARSILEDLSIDLNAKIRTLSKGNKEKVQLAMVMSREAKLYLLDEPIAGVDPATRDYILRTVITNKPEDSTVIISTHLIRDVEDFLDEFIFLTSGNIYSYDSVERARNQTGRTLDELFREVFRC